MYQVVPQVESDCPIILMGEVSQMQIHSKRLLFLTVNSVGLKPMAMRLPSVKPAVKYYRNDTRLMKRSVINE